MATTVVFAEEDTLFRLMQVALLRKQTPEGERTLDYFFGADFAEPLACLTSMADRLGLPPEIRAIVCRDDAELDSVLEAADAIVLERTPLTASRLLASAPRLKLVQQFGQDTRHIDLEAARRHRIPVATLLRLSTLSCADHIVALVLMLARDLVRAHGTVMARRNPALPPSFPAGPPRNTFNWGRISTIRVLAEHTVGFLGMGEIAGIVAQRLSAMGMRVLYHKRTRLTRDEETRLGGITYVSRDDLLAQSDFVSINVPYEPATEKIADAAFFGAMKRGACYINTSRGGTCDERALYDALKRGHLGGAALDVYRYEPVPPDCPLLELDNVVWTPHMAGGRPEFMIRESEAVLANIARALRGEPTCERMTP
jgi:phosphoglycerate dehydrogenase-like enzyme